MLDVNCKFGVGNTVTCTILSSVILSRIYCILPLDQEMPALPRVRRVKGPLVLLVDLLEELVEPPHPAHDVALELPGYEPSWATVCLSEFLGESAV